MISTEIKVKRRDLIQQISHMVKSQKKRIRKGGGIITVNSKQRMAESVQTAGRIMKQKSADETMELVSIVERKDI